MAVTGPLNVTVREALGRTLQRARIDQAQVERKLEQALEEVRREERELLRLEDVIIDLTEALGDDEAARWQA